MPNSKQIVYLSQAQYTELIANGSIIVNGVTVTYDENDIYVTPQAEPVTDVRVNGASITSGGMANVPIAGRNLGVVKTYVNGNGFYGLYINNDGLLTTQEADPANIKAGSGQYNPITPRNQHYSVFYGLAKIAGDTTQPSLSYTTAGTYTPEAKGAIQSMLGVSDLIATAENDLIASKAYAIGDVFTANGKLYKVISAIAADGAIVLQNEGETVSGANAVETKVGEGFVKFTDYAQQNVPGIVGINSNYGITINNQQPGHYLYLNPASDTEIKAAATTAYKAVTPYKQHVATFYGLAKAAGADEKDSTLPVGQYTDTAKAAIRSMIGAENGDDIIKVQDTEPTTAATKIWLPETAPASVAVPTVDEMEQALSGKVDDVQVNGTSVVGQDGVANVPIATASAPGVVKVDGRGLAMSNTGVVQLMPAASSKIKTADDNFSFSSVKKQHESAFYGLAKAAGDTTQSQSSNAVGTYTPEAKTAIQTMLNVIPAPSSPATGAFLVWSGSAWVAQTLSTWQGGNY